MTNIKDSKWAKVRDYYRLHLIKKPSPEKIEELYKKMLLLGEELKEHCFRKPGLKPKLGCSPTFKTFGKDG